MSSKPLADNDLLLPLPGCETKNYLLTFDTTSFIILKTTFMKTACLCCATALLLASCSQPQENNEEKLRNFYAWYISYNDTSRVMVPKDSIEKYRTKSFIKTFLHNPELDYDPITSTQDYDKSWTNSIMVSKATQDRQKIYRVSFLIDDKEKISHNIVVTMGKEHGEWKIDLVKDI